MLRSPRLGRRVVGLVLFVLLSLTPWMIVRAAPRAAASADQRASVGAEAVPAGLSARDWSALQAAMPMDLRQEAYLKASNNQAYDVFGYSVAVWGDTVVVGVFGEDSATTGVNGDQSDNSSGNAGAVYVFVRDGAMWTQQAYLKASNTGRFDYFGHDVAIEGDTIVVGAVYEDSAAMGVNGDQSDNTASDAGAAYVFVRDGTTWTQQAYLKASNTDAGDQFGASVAVDGDTIVVGTYNEASAATGVNGNQADNTAENAGAVYVFERDGTSWSQQAYLKASNTDANDVFGRKVAIDGDTIVVGAHGEDSAATGVNGDASDNTATVAGAAYVFVRAGVTWTQQAYLKASNTEARDFFGRSVAIDGDTIAVGASQEPSAATGVNGDQSDNTAEYAGAAYVFERDGATWTQQAYLKASNTNTGDYFGDSIAIEGDTIVVGARFEDSAATGINGDASDNTAEAAGAAYVFVRAGVAWAQQTYLKAANTDADDYFGESVTISGNTIVVGARLEDSVATGINGDASDNTAESAGAAYVFAPTPPEPTQTPTNTATNTPTSTPTNTAPSTPTSTPTNTRDEYGNQYADEHANSNGDEYDNQYADEHSDEHAHRHADEHADEYGNECADPDSDHDADDQTSGVSHLSARRAATRRGALRGRRAVQQRSHRGASGDMARGVRDKFRGCASGSSERWRVLPIQQRDRGPAIACGRPHHIEGGWRGGVFVHLRRTAAEPSGWCRQAVCGERRRGARAERCDGTTGGQARDGGICGCVWRVWQRVADLFGPHSA